MFGHVFCKSSSFKCRLHFFSDTAIDTIIEKVIVLLDEANAVFKGKLKVS